MYQQGRDSQRAVKLTQDNKIQQDNSEETNLLLHNKSLWDKQDIDFDQQVVDKFHLDKVVAYNFLLDTDNLHHKEVHNKQIRLDNNTLLDKLMGLPFFGEGNNSLEDKKYKNQHWDSQKLTNNIPVHKELNGWNLPHNMSQEGKYPRQHFPLHQRYDWVLHLLSPG